MGDITIESQQEKISKYLEGFYVSHLINIGTELGLFEELNKAKAGITISELASNLSLHEPYVKIWCQTAYFQEIIDMDEQERVKLMPYLDALLVDKTGDKYVAGRVRLAVKVHGDRMSEYPEYYQSGGYSTSYSAERSNISAQAIESGHRSIVFLFSILPEEDRLKKKLSNEFKFLDIGCGQGSFLMKMAESFPQGQYIGIDPIKHGIDVANKKITELGLNNNITLENIGGEEVGYTNEFDIVCMVLTLHEIIPDIRQRVVEKAYQALKKDGLLLIVDFSYPSKLSDFRNPDYGMGIMDQFFETTLGITHLAAKLQESMLGNVGFDEFQRTSLSGIDLLTAIKL